MCVILVNAIEIIFFKFVICKKYCLSLSAICKIIPEKVLRFGEKRKSRQVEILLDHIIY